jgi:hypothetical protein
MIILQLIINFSLANNKMSLFLKFLFQKIDILKTNKCSDNLNNNLKRL